jgi:hypothetical protein
VFHVERRELVEFFKTGTRDLFGVHLTDQQLEQFTTFLEQLKAWNQSTNLTSITSDEDIVVKHFIDSLAALSVEAMVSGAKILDVGSGAGFPGIPLKIARPDLLMTLLEPTYKKVAFLHFAYDFPTSRLYPRHWSNLLWRKAPQSVLIMLLPGPSSMTLF